MCSRSARVISAKTTGAILILVCVAFLAPGCGRGIEMGPYPYNFPVIPGILASTSFAGDQEITSEMMYDVCFLPSESQIQEYLSETAPVGGEFLAVSRIQLGSARLTVLSGDPGDITEIALYYQPVDDPNGERLIASASSPTGFGSTVELTQANGVNFLDIIRENDASTSDECPRLRVRARASQMPKDDIAFTTELSMDIYVRVGL